MKSRRQTLATPLTLLCTSFTNDTWSPLYFIFFIKSIKRARSLLFLSFSSMRSYGIFLNLFLEFALRITNNVYLNLLIKLQRFHFIPLLFFSYIHLVCLNKRSEQNDSNYTYFFYPLWNIWWTPNDYDDYYTMSWLLIAILLTST